MKLAPATLATSLAVGALFVIATLSSFSVRGDEGPPTPAPAQTAGAPQPCAQDGQLFRPEDLVLLEMPDRELWQQPDVIMDALNIADASDVADVGAGAGWFTIRLARRVPNGTVYAQDLQREMVTAIARRVNRVGLENVRVVQGEENSPNLPARALDAVLVVDVYPEVETHNRVTFLRSLAESLRPKGRIGIVNYKPGGGGPGPCHERRVASAVVEEDARQAGLRVLSRVNLQFQYLVVIGL